MNDILAKPATLGDLQDVIARYVWPHRSEPLAGRRDSLPACVASSVLSTVRLEELRRSLPADTLGNSGQRDTAKDRTDREDTRSDRSHA